MSAAIYGLIGVIIGGGISLLGTWITVQRSSKLELDKLRLSFLMEKRALIQQFFDKSNFSPTGDQEEDQDAVQKEFGRISLYLKLRAHFFVDSRDLEGFQMQIDHIIREISPFDYIQLYSTQSNVVESVHKFLNNELKSTVRKIQHIIGD